MALKIMARKNNPPFPTIGLPAGRDVTIVGHVWPHTSLMYKDLRFHVHSKFGTVPEVDTVYALLRSFSKDVHINKVSNVVKCIVETPLVPLIMKKCTDLGLSVKWIDIKT